MNPAFEVITFDCYGTLIDWEGGITEAFREAAAADGVTLEREDILRAHAEIEPQVQAGPYRSYREVLGFVARKCADRLGWRLDPARAGFLAASVGTWLPFADVNPGLTELRAEGIRLGILSNIDDALLRATLRHFSVPFEMVITAEQVRSYKPAHPHFLTARARIGEARWLHAAQSYFHDVAPARALGIPVAWVNRKHELPQGPARPDVEVDSLTGLVAWLEEG